MAEDPQDRDENVLHVPPTNSRTVTGTVVGEHEHTIVGYSLIKGIGDGEPIASERFTVGGHEWVLLFYPDGKRSATEPAVVGNVAGLAGVQWGEGLHVPAGGAPHGAAAIPPPMPGGEAPAPEREVMPEDARERREGRAGAAAAAPAVGNALVPAVPAQAAPVPQAGLNLPGMVDPPQAAGMHAAAAAHAVQQAAVHAVHQAAAQAALQHAHHMARGAAVQPAVNRLLDPPRGAPPPPAAAAGAAPGGGGAGGAGGGHGLPPAAGGHDGGHVPRAERAGGGGAGGGGADGGGGEARRDSIGEYAALFVALIGEGARPQGVVHSSDGRIVRAFHRFTLVDQTGGGRHITKGRRREQGAVKISCARQDPNARNCHGYRKFVKRSVLENKDNGYLVNDQIVIRYQIELVVTAGGALARGGLGADGRAQGGVGGAATSWGAQLLGNITPALPDIGGPALGDQLGELLESKEGADVTIVVEGEELRAHRLILGARSKVFKALLEAPMKEGQEGRVVIQDVRAPVFTALLHFAYTGHLPDQHEGNNLEVTMAQHLLAAADRYELVRLRQICERRLCEAMEVDAAATTLALAEQNHAVELKRVCLEFVAHHLGEVMATEGWEHMRNSCPQLQAEVLEAVVKAGGVGGGAGVEGAGNGNGNEYGGNYGRAGAGGGGNGAREAAGGLRRPAHQWAPWGPAGEAPAGADGAGRDGRRVRARLAGHGRP